MFDPDYMELFDRTGVRYFSVVEPPEARMKTPVEWGTFISACVLGGACPAVAAASDATDTHGVPAAAQVLHYCTPSIGDGGVKLLATDCVGTHPPCHVPTITAGLLLIGIAISIWNQEGKKTIKQIHRGVTTGFQCVPGIHGPMAACRRAPRRAALL